MVSIPLLLFTLVALTVLVIAGGRHERLAAAAFTVVMVVSPLVYGLTVENVRWMVALLSLSLFGVLLWLSLTAERWWLMAAAGCQLLAVSTYVVAFVRPEELIWSGVTVRWIVWLELMAICLFGAWEARAARRFQNWTLR